MLGLGHKVVGHPFGKGSGVRDNQDLARPLRRVYADRPEDLQLRRRYVVVAGTDDLIRGCDALRAVSHRRYRLGPANGVHLVQPEQPGHRQHPPAHPSIISWRDADADLLYPGNLGRNRGHHQRARVRPVTAGDVEPGPAQRPHPLSRGRPVSGRLPRAVHLPLVEQPDVLYSDLKGVLQLSG